MQEYAWLCRKFALVGQVPLCFLIRKVQGGVKIDFKGSHFEKEIILWGVRWYVAYPLSYRHLEEMMAEHGVSVDYSTLNRWVLNF